MVSLRVATRDHRPWCRIPDAGVGSGLGRGNRGAYRAAPSFSGCLMPYKANEARRHKISRARYKVCNWPEYDRALQQRGSLTVWVTPEALAAWHSKGTRETGRPVSRVVLAYEAGRDGFWLARYLRARGVEVYIIQRSTALMRSPRRCAIMPAPHFLPCGDWAGSALRPAGRAAPGFLSALSRRYPGAISPIACSRSGPRCWTGATALASRQSNSWRSAPGFCCSRTPC